MKNRSGMSIISSILLLAALSLIMISVAQRACMAYEMACEAECIFYDKEALNSLAQASVALCIKLMKSSTKGQFPQEFTGSCIAWPYASDKKIPAFITITIESAQYGVVLAELHLANGSKKNVSYVLALRNNEWWVEDWTIKTKKKDREQ